MMDIVALNVHMVKLLTQQTTGNVFENNVLKDHSLDQKSNAINVRHVLSDKSKALMDLGATNLDPSAAAERSMMLVVMSVCHAQSIKLPMNETQSVPE